MRWMAPAHGIWCQGVKAVRHSRAKREPSVMKIITIGLDLAKTRLENPPITGNCRLLRVASGQATAAPPKVAMNSRRFDPLVRSAPFEKVLLHASWLQNR